MSAEKQHHPSCSARFGGLCVGCPSIISKAIAHEPDITCDVCGQTWLNTGDSIPARRAALAAWSGCDCTPNSSEALGEVASEDTDADLSAPSPRADRQAAGVEHPPAPPAATHRTSLPRALASAVLADVKRNLGVVRGIGGRGFLSGVPGWAARRWAVGR